MWPALRHEDTFPILQRPLWRDEFACIAERAITHSNPLLLITEAIFSRTLGTHPLGSVRVTKEEIPMSNSYMGYYFVPDAIAAINIIEN